MPTTKMVAIRGSQKQPLPDSTEIAPAPRDERLEVTVRLRPKAPLPKASDMLKSSSAPIPAFQSFAKA
jgi:hypothetical protein